MFSKKKKQSSGVTYLSADCHLTGSLTLEADCMVDGSIEGQVKALGTVNIEHRGRIEGQLEANEVRVAGTFKGKLKCQRLSIAASGVVDGEVMSEKIEIYEGGQFIGSRVKEELPQLENKLEAAEA